MMIHAMTQDRNIEEKEMVTERIFIAEDEESIRTLMARYLSTKGFEVSEAHNGKEALEQIIPRKPAPQRLVIRDASSFD